MVLVSPRNSNKESIQPEDMIVCSLSDENNVLYHNTNKPSVDSPIQLKLYDKFPKINFMIHGHAFIKNATITDDYRLCGDFREVESVSPIIELKDSFGYLNLKNHGFLIYSDTIENLEKIINSIEFFYERN